MIFIKQLYVVSFHIEWFIEMQFSRGTLQVFSNVCKREQSETKIPVVILTHTYMLTNQNYSPTGN